ncbi:MAG: trypsin-like peptidase domain-containing protein [Hyphomicrobiales bacterium]|nr:trypsin-like peptidase domain-containing protein [Hyphomicrobiales bacterium]
MRPPSPRPRTALPAAALWLAALAAVLVPAAFLAGPALAAGGGENPAPLYQSANLRAHIGVFRGGKWCTTQMQVILYLDSDAVFADGQAELTAFLDKLPDLLRGECDRVRAARVVGMLDGKQVYTASVNRLDAAQPRVNARITDRAIADKYRPAARPGDAARARGQRELVPRGAPATDAAPAPRDGTLFKAATQGEQCQVLAGWTGRLEREYAGDGQTNYSPQEFFARLANLFADAHFAPVFGGPYDGLGEAERLFVANQVLPRCPREYQQQRWVRFVYGVAFQRGQGEFNPAALAAEVADRRAARAWITQETARLDAVPATADGLAHLGRAAAEGDTRTRDLWPSERRTFLAAVAARRSTVALAVAADRVAALPPAAASLAALDAILDDTRPLVAAADRPALADLEALAGRRRDGIRTALVQAATADLDRVPATAAGLGELQSRRDRLRAAVGAATPLAALDAYDRAWQRRAAGVAEAALPAFRDELAALPATLDGAALAGRRLARVAPLVRAVAPSRVAAFERAARDAETRIHDRLIADAVARIRNTTGDWRAAADVVAKGRAEATAFRGTAAAGRAAAIERAATDRAAALAAAGRAGFARQVEAVDDGWPGIEALQTLDREVAADERAVPALADYRPLVAARRGRILAALADRAVAQVEAAGGGYADVDKVLDLAETQRRRFAAAGDTAAVQRINAALPARIDHLLRESLDDFAATLAKQKADWAAADRLDDLAGRLDKRAAAIPGYAPYAQAARQRRDAMRGEACDRAVGASGLGRRLARRPIMAAARAVTLRDFVCGLDARGHRVAEVADGPDTDDGADTLLMKISQADQVYAFITLRELEALPRQVVLVGIEKGDAARRSPITLDQWRVYAGGLLGRPVPAEVARRAAEAPVRSGKGGAGAGPDPRALVERLKAATVFLYVNPKVEGKTFSSSYGTGFFIGPDLIMTNQHVVRNAGDVVHVFSEAVGWKRATYVTGSGMMGKQGLDVAVLRIGDYRSDVHLPFARRADVFQDLVVAGYPGIANDNDKGFTDLQRFMIRHLQGDRAAYVRGTVPAVKYAFGKLQGEYRNASGFEVIQHGVQTARGNSGSAVVDMCGQVVGIHALGDFGGKDDKGTKFNYAYSAGEITRFLTARGIPFQVASGDCGG